MSHPSSSSATRPLSLKERIHRFKIPLSARGVRIARVAYFTLPIVAGVLVMQGTTAYEVRHRPEWIAEADPVAEAVRTQQQLTVLKDIAQDKDPRLP
jgi:hypothetical protein